MNWYLGWLMILAAFMSGAVLGLFFHRDDFLGSYGSLRRRLLRLGHIALAALGMVNILYGLSLSHSSRAGDGIASWGLIVGGISMPAVCFLSAWRLGFRHLFPIPVGCLIVAVARILLMGRP